MTDTAALLCSQFSSQAAEQLFGTASTVKTWFLLEYEGRWEPEAFENSDLPQPVKDHVMRHSVGVPQPRIQVIKHKPRLAPPGDIAFFVALSRDDSPVLYEFHLSSYDDLLALDLAAICAGDPAFEKNRRNEPLMLVCTHGRRDRCCAQNGVPIYEHIIQQAGASVWQTSHVAGHRFAGNMVILPDGLYYGRLDPQSAQAVIDAHRAGRVVPDHYRGRSCYSKVGQVAEYFLRAKTGIGAAEPVRLIGEERGADQQWIVRFAAAGQREFVLTLAEDPAAVQVYSSCGDAAPSAMSQFRLLDHTKNG
ncbi:MAG: hypothetical protein HY866_23070 [Chloroflexi bacterium]|nr:hypothetical protein [Chloroflexota bacterium]